MDFSKINWLIYTGAITAYVIIAYLYVAITNHDIIVYEERVELINRMPLFKKHKIFLIKEIKSVAFKHEWTETVLANIKPIGLRIILVNFIMPIFIPSEYKWIEICTSKKFKFYCFGIDTDMYDNPKPYFEELFIDLSEKQIAVSWTNSSDSYYDNLTKKALLNSKKEST